MSDETFAFDEPLEWRLAGTPEMVSEVLVALGRERAIEDQGLYVNLVESRAGGVRISVGVTDLGRVGYLELHELPGQRCRLRVPAHGGIGQEHWGYPQLEGLSAFLGTALKELRSLGFLSTSSRFGSRRVFETAVRELAAAEESESIAAVGNIMRSAMLALADELYVPHMLADGAEAPKKDDAKRKFELVINHYFAGRSPNYRKGLIRSVEGTWTTVSALIHRKQAQREEAEICLALVRAQFEVFSLMVPGD